MAMNYVPSPTPEADLVPEQAVGPSVEPDVAARDRWSSPFAVSGGGLAIVREPRSIVVLGADSVIAEAIAGQADTLLGLSGPDRAPASPASRSAPTSVATESTPTTRQAVSLLGEETTAARGASDQMDGLVRAAAFGAALSRPADDAGGDEPANVPFTVHRVEPGDTWSRIVIRYRITSQALAEANPDTDPDVIRTGQLLRIPEPVAVPPIRSHQVGRGETLRGIASRYNVSADEIRRANGMSDERVALGQTLLIPPAVDPAATDGG
jgi:LysM repeat protein